MPERFRGGSGYGVSVEFDHLRDRLVTTAVGGRGGAGREYRPGGNFAGGYRLNTDSSHKISTIRACILRLSLPWNENLRTPESNRPAQCHAHRCMCRSIYGPGRGSENCRRKHSRSIGKRPQQFHASIRPKERRDFIACTKSPRSIWERYSLGEQPEERRNASLNALTELNPDSKATSTTFSQVVERSRFACATRWWVRYLTRVMPNTFLERVIA